MSIDKFEEACAGRHLTEANLPEMHKLWRMSQVDCVRIFLAATNEAIEDITPFMGPLHASVSSPIIGLKDGRHNYFIKVTSEGSDENNLNALSHILRRPGIEIDGAIKFATDGSIIELTL